MDKEDKADGVEAKLVEDPNQEDEGITHKPHSINNNNLATMTNAGIV
jgi:hypothetical protein